MTEHGLTMTCIGNSPQSAYLTANDVLFIHECLVRRYGGTDGILNRDGLESAVIRASSGYYMSIAKEAAAITESTTIPFATTTSGRPLPLPTSFCASMGLSSKVTTEPFVTWCIRG